MHWLFHVFGLDKSTGPWYLWWSGFGGTVERLVELGVLGGLLYRRHNCHVHHCWRIGHFPVEGTPYWVCKKHHPEIDGAKLTHEHIIRAHRRAQL